MVKGVVYQLNNKQKNSDMGLYVYATLNSTTGLLKRLQEIEEVHVNTVRFTDQSTHDKSMLIEVDEWILLDDDNEPEIEVVALGYQDEILIGYIGEGVCESEGELLEEVTHWRPKPFTIEERKSVLNKGMNGVPSN